MKMRFKKLLGMTVEERSITVCQVLLNDRSQPTVESGDVFHFPENLSFDEPQSLGEAFKVFLRQNRLDAHRAAIGLPARSLLMKEKSLPPCDDAAAIDLLRLAAEREFSTDHRELRTDAVVPAASADEPRQAMLVAAHRKRIEVLQQFATAAELQLVSIGAIPLAVAAAADSHSNDELLLRITPMHLELLQRVKGKATVVRNLSTKAPIRGETSGSTWVSTLSTELRRVTAMLPRHPENTPRLAVWDSVGLPDNLMQAVGKRLSMPVNAENGLTMIGITQHPFNGSPNNNDHAAAVAMALTAARHDPGVVNFIDSRLQAVAAQRSRLRPYGLIGAAVALLFIVWLTYDMISTMRAAAAAEAELAAIAPTVKLAEAFRDDVQFARGWFDKRPQHVQCLMDITLAFPERGYIWVTSFDLRDDMRGTITGKATDKRYVFEVMDKMTRSNTISDVTLLNIRDSGNTGEESFSLTFTYRNPIAEDQP